MRTKQLIIALCLGVCLCGNQQAIATLWLGDTSSDWSTASNWSEGVPSASADTADLSTTSVTYECVFDAGEGSVTIGNINRIGAGRTLTVTGGTLTVLDLNRLLGGSDAAIDGTLAITGGTYNAGDGLSGSALWVGYNSAGTYLVDVSGTGTFNVNVAGDCLLGRGTTNYGIIRLGSGTPTVTFNKKPTIAAGGVGTYDFEPGSEGTLTITGADSAYYSGLYAAGSLTWNSSSSGGAFDDIFDVTGETLSLDPNAPPAIRIDQAPRVLVTPGDDVTLTTTAYGTTSYQWQIDDVNIVGATDPNLTITSADVSDEGIYTCIASGPGGTTTSDPVTVITERLIAHYSFDGDLTNDASETSAFTAPDATAAVPAEAVITASEVVIDGEPNRIMTAGNWNPLEYGDQLTVIAWVKLTGDPEQLSMIFAKHDDNVWNTATMFGLHVYEGVPRFGRFATIGSTWLTETVSATEPIPANEWAFVAATYDAGQITVFSNNADPGTGFENVSSGYADATISMGGLIAPVDAQYPFMGAIDDVAVYNYAMTADEVASEYFAITGQTTCIDRPALDISGPTEDPDCLVDMYDLASFAAEWLDCGFYPVSGCP